jgi:membrane protease subunit HflC
MKKLLIILGVIAVVGIGVIAAGPFFTLQEGEQAVVVQLGKIVNVVTDAGLHFRSPFLDVVVKFPKKIMPWDGAPERIQTKENQYIWVDTTARWKISDARKFYESVSTLENAYGRLDDVIDSAVRTVISANYLREAVRNSNSLVGTEAVENFQTGDAEGSAALDQLTKSDIVHEDIQKGREKLSQDMLAIVAAIVPEYGIEVIDIIPRQIRYSDELTESVYQRMIKERNQIAQAFRSLGEGKKAEWLGKLENEKRTILSEAYAKAETVKGKADAEASRVYADSYGKDASFYDFWKAIESYRQTLPSFSKTLTTDMEYFKYLYGSRGR